MVLLFFLHLGFGIGYGPFLLRDLFLPFNAGLSLRSDPRPFRLGGLPPYGNFPEGRIHLDPSRDQAGDVGKNRFETLFRFRADGTI